MGMVRNVIGRRAATSDRLARIAGPSVAYEPSGARSPTAAATLGEMILRSSDRDGVALRNKERGAWREVS